MKGKAADEIFPAIGHDGYVEGERDFTTHSTYLNVNNHGFGCYVM